MAVQARVLIVARDDAVAGPLSEGLDRLGWRTVTARGPNSAAHALSDLQIEAVIVDLAASAGGNVEGTVAGETIDKHGVTIIGASNLARSLPADSSALFARNLYNFLSAFWNKDTNAPELPDDDEIVKAIRLTRDGKVVNDRLAKA